MSFQLNEESLIKMATPLYIIVIGGEILLSHLQLKKYYTVKDTLMNIYLSLLNAGIDLLFRAIYLFIILQWFYVHRLVESYTQPWVYWLLLFVLEDLVYYFEHRVDHYCRLFWAVHVTHHSSDEFNLTTGFRSSVFQPLYRFVYFIPLAFVGFKPVDIVFMYALTQIYGILVHTKMVQKMPAWFEVLFVSPSHHRVHHASNVRYLDKNMGMCLIIWDKLFGTFQEELPEEPVVYGLTKPLENPHHPVKIIFHEWQSLGKDLGKKTTFFIRLKYLFMPPGWSHDGSSKTTRELRKEIGL
ncbi:MAG TPA: sterol desaturase family protein [Ferruginibacter sp.]|nr:sterol desaturase family protein [Ferruginibacter sp.]